MIELMALCLLSGGSRMPAVEVMMMDGDRAAFSRCLASAQRVEVDLRPLCAQYGMLSPEQTVLAFDDLLKRYRVAKAQILSKQGDTNYAWIELVMQLDLVSRRDRVAYRVDLVFQFKIQSEAVVMTRWVLQDLQ